MEDADIAEFKNKQDARTETSGEYILHLGALANWQVVI